MSQAETKVAGGRDAAWHRLDELVGEAFDLASEMRVDEISRKLGDLITAIRSANYDENYGKAARASGAHTVYR